jgi:hypothetical protein
MRRMGSITAAALWTLGAAAWTAAIGMFGAVVALQDPPRVSGVEILVTGGIFVTLLLLMLGKILANERAMGKLEGAWLENSKRDDSQEKGIAELWAEARTIPERIRIAKHDAVNDVSEKVAEIQLRYERQIDKLEERMRELEHGGTRRPT